MKILAISDVHCRFSRFSTSDMPDANIVIIAGDLTNTGKIRGEDRTASYWLQRLSEKYGANNVLWIPGNHDIDIKGYPDNPNIVNIYQKTVEYGGLSIYGESLCTAFDMPELAKVWAHTTFDNELDLKTFDFKPVDIVVSHSPPYTLCDCAGIELFTRQPIHIGSPGLLAYIDRHSPKLVICGHVHEAAGTIKYKNTWIYNVAQRAVLIDTDTLG